jgi:hypothetical protein
MVRADLDGDGPINTPQWPRWSRTVGHTNRMPLSALKGEVDGVADRTGDRGPVGEGQQFRWCAESGTAIEHGPPAGVGVGVRDDLRADRLVQLVRGAGLVGNAQRLQTVLAVRDRRGWYGQYRHAVDVIPAPPGDPLVSR